MCNKKSESIFEKPLKEATLVGCNTFVLGDFNLDLKENCSKCSDSLHSCYLVILGATYIIVETVNTVFLVIVLKMVICYV